MLLLQVVENLRQRGYLTHFPVLSSGVANHIHTMPPFVLLIGVGGGGERGGAGIVLSQLPCPRYVVGTESVLTTSTVLPYATQLASHKHFKILVTFVKTFRKPKIWFLKISLRKQNISTTFRQRYCVTWASHRSFFMSKRCWMCTKRNHWS